MKTFACLAVLLAEVSLAAATPSPLLLVINQPAGFTTASTVSMSGSVAGGSGMVKVTWSTDRGFLGTAQGSESWTVDSIPLMAGSNVVTIAALDSTGGQVSQTFTLTRQSAGSPVAPSVQITSPAGPAYSTGRATVTLSGWASDGMGIANVSWTNSAGGSGVAAGSTAWTTGAIPLLTGVNVLTVTAYSLSGATPSASLTVTLNSPPQPPPNPNQGAPPTLTVLSPVNTTLATNNSTIVVSGTVQDGVGVVSITWTNSVGGSGTANGTLNWSTGPIPLLVGMNAITITALDSEGNTSWRSLTVTRK